MTLKRFYSLPPKNVDHPYILVNIKNLKKLFFLNYEHCIVDCGIYDLLKPPYRHGKRKIETWKKLKVRDGWKVVPDCPSLKYEFGIKTDFDNTEYSWELLEELYNPSDKTQMPVIQAYIIKDSYSYKKSVKEYVKKFKREYGEKQEVIGCGSVCKAGSKEMVNWIIHYIRKEFPNSWIHAFGMKLNHLQQVYRIIDSFDSMSWQFPRTSGLPSRHRFVVGEGVYFQNYLDRINELKNKQTNLQEFKYKEKPKYKGARIA